MIQLTEAEHAALVADAQRFRGIRLILCEQDKGVQARMLDAVESLMEAQPDVNREEAPTAERVNELADAFILAAAGARNG